MDQWIHSCSNFKSYPQNLTHHTVLEHNLNAYKFRLARQKDRLFEEEYDAALEFLELSDPDTGFRNNRIISTNMLKQHLRQVLAPGTNDPRCRFAFINAPHSRAPLRISHEMFCFLLTYHQVMPAFLDFIFPFGEQEYEQDFHFCGFREENHLDNGLQGLLIPELGRSGCELRLCYNLRSVERSGSTWSIRQTAVYHSFDLENGHSLWITVKGNNCIKDRITESLSPLKKPKFQTRDVAFSASLVTHLLMCDWAGENWRWYINDLEHDLQKLTRHALSTPVGKLPDSVPDIMCLSPSSPIQRNRTGTFFAPSHSATDKLPMSPLSKSETLSSTTRAQAVPPSQSSHSRTVTNESNCLDKTTGLRIKPDDSSLPHNESFAKSVKNLNSNFTLPQLLTSQFKERLNLNENPGHVEPQSARQEPPELPPELQEDKDPSSQEEFEFSDLQRIQYIEEKTQEAVLVLNLNIEVLEELKQHYRYMIKHASFPKEINAACGSDIAKFEKCVNGVEKDLRMQKAKTETLLHLVAERKSLLYGILQYRSMKASEFFALRAQRSADNMESMTNSMHEIAQKTKQETVSMRVITLVTLFFLPGTFIATFMSTDIIHFNTNNTQNFQMNGFKLYLEICIPLMFLTFLAWYAFHWWVNKKDNHGNDQDIEQGI
ncbi:hypothetical protein GQ43DRAFT_428635 [Delitschia confertaspora ATCC 74209]|uniref:CorA-like transporter domain-containing protein n=1 Tax=Delitschia confertaspora ATCC 74209 TaxID=1513339 RepID=A0A9P4MVL3_9PLEO|nr:hypothetical protein GQ43DRAFT_428635 [Delitschia confertaspora ATCC 74209]